MQDETPDAWYVDLVEFDLADALEAARTTTLAKTFIGIGDLVAECQQIARRRAGRERLAELERQREAENPPAELPARDRPLAALMAGTPIKSAPRPSWADRRGGKRPIVEKPAFTAEELAAARAELDAARPAGEAS